MDKIYPDNILKAVEIWCTFKPKMIVKILTVASIF